MFIRAELFCEVHNVMVCVQVGTGEPSLQRRPTPPCRTPQREPSWCGTAATLCTCWPCRSGRRADPPASGSSTAAPSSCWTPAPGRGPASRPSPTSQAWCSTTWGRSGKRRSGGRRSRRRRRSPPSRRPRRRRWCWSWSGPCTNLRTSRLCSTWHALSSTDTAPAWSSCRSPSRCCVSCRTTPSRCEQERSWTDPIYARGGGDTVQQVVWTCGGQSQRRSDVTGFRLQPSCGEQEVGTVGSSDMDAAASGCTYWLRNDTDFTETSFMPFYFSQQNHFCTFYMCTFFSIKTGTYNLCAA